jgi:hypothetical protein
MDWELETVLVDGVPVTTVGLLFNGAPTAISQRCPGSPWAGFIPGATAVVATGCAILSEEMFIGVVPLVAGSGAGLLFKGAPTEMSQRWPGSPWAGFIPAATGVVAAGRDSLSEEIFTGVVTGVVTEGVVC